MDALALLCTLHADGPATWRRLRESRCTTLAELERLAPDELAELLGGTPAGARRFLREARLLAERAGGAWLEREEPASEPAASAVPARARPDRLPPRDQRILDEVVRTWRERDAETEDTVQGLEPAPPEPVAATAVPAADAIAPGTLDGPDEEASRRLAAQGVVSLPLLLAADLGRVALATGLGYSRLYRWRSLAARVAQTPPVAAAPQERVSPAEVPAVAGLRDLLQPAARGDDLPRRALRWSPIEESPAGPFA